MDVHSTFFSENDENFIKSSYNGIEVIIRESDKYINATALCNQNKRDFRTLKRGERWRHIVEYFEKYLKQKDVQFCTPLYILQKGYNLMQGQYVHPKLIHFVAEWVSIEYSFSVMEIMNAVNDRLQATKESFEKVTNEIIEEQKRKIKELEIIVEHKDEELFELSTRTPVVSTKFLTIVEQAGG